MAKIKELYIDQFTDYTTYCDVGEYRILFPPMPAKKDIVNYGIPPEKQFYKKASYEINGKSYFPCDLIGELWVNLPESKKKEIYHNEWEKIHNGEWQYIAGRTIYINGYYYFFLNYYKSDGFTPDFWDSQWFNSLLTLDSYYNEYVLGQLDIKRRRGGWTMMKNAFAAYVAVAHTYSNVGLMGYNIEDSLTINFEPIRDCILGLPDFLLGEPYLSARKNNTLGKEKTAKAMTFDGSSNRIFTKATKEKGFDGQKLRFAVIDEFCKWENTNPLKTLEKNTLCIKSGGQKIYLRNRHTGKKIKPAGLCQLLSSVDEINDSQISVINKMWDGCSPETAIGSSCSSLDTRRYFSPAFFGYNDEHGSCIDEFGFSDVEKAKALIQEVYENKLKYLGYEEAREFKRKHPFTIEDALTPSSEVCQFNIDRLEMARINALELPLDSPKRPVFTQLHWNDAFNTVYADPKPEYRDFNINARFSISGHPDVPNNIQNILGKKVPLNVGKYIASLDPIDYNKGQLNINTKGSLPCLRIKRVLDMAIDGDKFDDMGNPLNNGLDFETNRTVAIYFFRPDDVKELWDDIAKALIYWGCPLLYERSTRTVFDFLDQKGMMGFLLDAKGNLINEATRDSYGIKTTEESKRNYFDAARIYIERYGLAERHIECIEQMTRVTPTTMPKYDIAAAYMIGEFIDNHIAYKYRDALSDTQIKSLYENLKF